MSRYRRITSAVRVLPEFLIIGAQKSGTTSLHSALSRHPCVISATPKELAFFDRKFDRGFSWYRAHFPTLFRKIWYERTLGRKFATFEASVSYMFHPHAPRRISEILPNVKVIAMLRNPVDRAYSDFHYRNDSSLHSFEDAIAKEEDGKVARDELENILKDENYPCNKYYRFSYLARGIYVDQFKNVMRFIPRERILIIKSEDFFEEPSVIFERVLHFLGLPPWQPGQFEIRKKGTYPKINLATRKRLAEYFEPHNQRLYDFLGVDFGWR